MDLLGFLKNQEEKNLYLNNLLKVQMNTQKMDVFLGES
jgi:hypothetical protein